MSTERAGEPGRKLSDLVAEARLETSFLDASTQHIYHNGAGGQSVPARRVENWSLDAKRPILGSGSFGTVRLERCQQSSSRMRAVKEIKKHDQQQRVIDYSRELEAIVQFSRPQYSHCFVQSHGWFENESSIFIAMEYHQWGDLSRHLYSPLPEDEVRQIISQVVEGIVYMHEKGFIHRDLKPSNIMVVSNGPYWSVKITDFGISKQRFLQESLNTVGVGTIGYAAPEQIGLSSNDVSVKDDSSTQGFPADMWSIGILSVKLFTGQVPFKDLTALSQYLSSSREARALKLESPLKQQGASKSSQKFIVDLLQVEPDKRMGVYQASLHEWLAKVGEVSNDVHNDGLNDLSMLGADLQNDWLRASQTFATDTDAPSASWGPTTQDPSFLSPLTAQVPVVKEPASATAISPKTERTTTAAAAAAAAATDIRRTNSTLGSNLRKHRQGVSTRSLNENQPIDSSSDLLFLLRQPTTLSHQDQLTLIRESIEFSVITPSLIGVISKFCSESQDLKTEMMASSLEVIQDLVRKGEDDKAVPLVRLMLDNMDSLSVPSHLQVVRLTAAVVIVNSPGFSTEAQKYTSRDPELKATVAVELSKKIDWLLKKQMFEDVIKILEQEKLDPLVPAATTEEGQKSHIDLNPRLRLAKAYMGQRRFQDAIKVLEHAITHPNADRKQVPFVHQSLAEAYSKINFWTSAKSHALESVTILQNTLGDDDRHTLAAIKLVYDICKATKDKEESHWAGLWMKLAGNHVMRIQEETTPPQDSSITARGFFECQQAMIELAADGPEKAAMLGVRYLEDNYVTDEPICFECIKNYLIQGACLFSAIATRFDCKAHNSEYRNFSVVHFLAIARPRVEENGEGCLQEMRALLNFAYHDPSVVNALAEYKPAELQSSSDVISASPLWLAAFKGKSQIVEHILALDSSDASIGARSLCSLPWLMRKDLVTVEVVDTTIVKAVRALSAMTISSLLQDPFLQQYCSWVWCFSGHDLLELVLQKCGKDPRDLSVRACKPDSKRSRETRMKPIAIALADIDISSGSVPIDRAAALVTISSYQGDGNSQDSLDGQPSRGTFKHRIIPSQEPRSALDHLAIRLSEALTCISPPRWIPEDLALEEKRIHELRREIRVSTKMAHWILDRRGSVDKRSQHFWSEVEIRFNYLETGSFRRNLAIGMSAEDRRARRTLDLETSHMLMKCLQPVLDKII